ncbi:MAG: hypothetical protein L3J96_04320, partial [Thermoplasmata archaeon]|nr:hypothetical protein [Thermoplasmata archaeon]
TAGIPLVRGTPALIANAAFPSTPVHVAVVGRTGDRLFESVTPIAEVHVRVRCPHGRIFINGHRPYLAPLVLSQEAGPEPYHLTQVL